MNPALRLFRTEFFLSSFKIGQMYCTVLAGNLIFPQPNCPGGGGGTPYLKWQVCAYSKSKVGAYQVKCVLSKIWGHSVNNPSKNQAIPYQVQ